MVGFDDQTLPYMYNIILTSETTITYYIGIQGTWTINFDYSVSAQTPATLIKQCKRHCLSIEQAIRSLKAYSKHRSATDASLDVWQAYPFDKHLLNIDLEVSQLPLTPVHAIIYPGLIDTRLPGKIQKEVPS